MRGSLCARVAARRPSSTSVPVPSSLLRPCSLAPHTEDIAVSLLTDIRIVSRQPAKSADLHCTGTGAKWYIEPLDARLRKTTRDPERPSRLCDAALLFSFLLFYSTIRHPTAGSVVATPSTGPLSRWTLADPSWPSVARSASIGPRVGPAR